MILCLIYFIPKGSIIHIASSLICANCKFKLDRCKHQL